MPQSDVLIPSLTVQECLRYSALLRLPPDTSPLDLQVGMGGSVCFLWFFVSVFCATWSCATWKVEGVCVMCSWLPVSGGSPSQHSRPRLAPTPPTPAGGH